MKVLSLIRLLMIECGGRRPHSCRSELQVWWSCEATGGQPAPSTSRRNLCDHNINLNSTRQEARYTHSMSTETRSAGESRTAFAPGQRNSLARLMDGCDRCSELVANFLKINPISFASSECRDDPTCPARVRSECRDNDCATVTLFGIRYQEEMRIQAPL